MGHPKTCKNLNGFSEKIVFVINVHFIVHQLLYNQFIGGRAPLNPPKRVIVPGVKKMIAKIIFTQK